MSVPIEALTLVMRRTALDVSYPGGADAMADWLAEEALNARWVVGDEHLIAASFMTADIHPVLDVLLDRGFMLEDAEGDHEAVVVDAMLGVAYPCAWLEWAPPEGERFSICWLAGTSPGDLAVPDGHTLGEDAPLRAQTRWDPDMVRLGMDGTAEVWLNTRTGQVEYHAAQPCRTEPGPVMQAVLEGLPETVQDAELSDGDAEELFGTVYADSLPCVLRVRTFEGQNQMEAALFIPIKIPEGHLDHLKAMVAEVHNGRIDPHSSTACGYANVILDDLPTPSIIRQLMDILREAAEGIVIRLRALAETEDHAWLRAHVGLEADGAPESVTTPNPLSDLALDLKETGWARVRVGDLLDWLGADTLSPALWVRIAEGLESAGLDPSILEQAHEGDWITFTAQARDASGLRDRA